jgi:hypothetical protein
VNDSAAITQISTSIYQALAIAHQTQPTLLSEPYRQKNWSSNRNRTVLLEKLTDELGRSSDPVQRAKEILQKLTTPEFAFSREYRQLMQKMQAVCSKPTPEPEVSGGITALLMDAENLRLTETEEGAIANLCQHPLRCKIAFGNWKSLNGHDARLHQRGYQLIHVPTGKNAADLQMTAVGASIFLYYPDLREVIVCSSDEHLLPLRNLLQSRGLIVHRVACRDKTLIVTHATGAEVRMALIPTENCEATTSAKQNTPKAAQSTSQKAEPKVNAHSTELQAQLVSLLKELLPQAIDGYVSVQFLGFRFKEVYGRSVTDLLKERKLAATFLKFLRQCPQFKLQQVNEDWQVALAQEDAALFGSTPFGSAQGAG